MLEFKCFANSLFLTTVFKSDFMFYLVGLYYKEKVKKEGSSPLKLCVLRGVPHCRT